jgi:hypothetical protein
MVNTFLKIFVEAERQSLAQNVLSCISPESPWLPMLPEFVYGTTERYFNESVYEVWRVVGISSTPWLRPGAGHLLVTHIAAERRTPILTTNFDILLELAAEALGLRPVTSVALPGQPFEPVFAASSDEVAIWKLHGTADNPSSVFSNVRSIAAPKRDVARAAAATLQQPSRRLVVIGYSGSDLDIFPNLATQSLPSQPLWFGLEFDDWHRSNLLTPRALQVQISFEQFARTCASTFDVDIPRASAYLRDRLGAPNSESDISQMRSVAMIDHVEGVARRFTDRERQRLVLAEILENGGHHSLALELFSDSERWSDDLRIEATRISAKSKCEKGDIEGSAKIAASTLNSISALSIPQRAELEFALLYAETRLIIPGIDVGAQWAPTLPRVIRIGWKSLLTSLRYFPRFRNAASEISEPQRSPFIDGYLEHQIRTLATLQRVALNIAAKLRVRKLVAVLFRPGWRLLLKSCERSAYAEGVGNCLRYLQRVTEVSSDPSLNVHQFLGHPLGVAISLRDEAKIAIAHGDRIRAQSCLQQSLNIAIAISDPLHCCAVIEFAREVEVDIDARGALPVVREFRAPWAQEAIRGVEIFISGSRLSK